MIVLLLGGIRAGKTDIAQQIVGQSSATYLATAQVTDDRMARKVAAHQNERPTSWTTIEEPFDIAAPLREAEGPVILDALNTWIANDVEGADISKVIQALTVRRGSTVVVSAEVGLGGYRTTPLGWRYTDRLGDANHAVAAVADMVLLVVAGRTLRLRNWQDVITPDDLQALQLA